MFRPKCQATVVNEFSYPAVVIELSLYTVMNELSCYCGDWTVVRATGNQLALVVVDAKKII